MPAAGNGNRNGNEICSVGEAGGGSSRIYRLQSSLDIDLSLAPVLSHEPTPGIFIIHQLPESGAYVRDLTKGYSSQIYTIYSVIKKHEPLRLKGPLHFFLTQLQ